MIRFHCLGLISCISVIQKLLCFVDSFPEKWIVLEQIENSFDTTDIKVDKHASDFWSEFWGNLMDDWEEHFTKDVSLLLFAEVFELSHSLFQKLHGRDRRRITPSQRIWLALVWSCLIGLGHGRRHLHLRPRRLLLLTLIEGLELLRSEAWVHLILRSWSLVHLTGATGLSEVLLMMEILLILHIIHIPLMIIILFVEILPTSPISIVIVVVLSPTTVASLVPIVSVTVVLPVAITVIVVLFWIGSWTRIAFVRNIVASSSSSNHHSWIGEQACLSFVHVPRSRTSSGADSIWISLGRFSCISDEQLCFGQVWCRQARRSWWVRWFWDAIFHCLTLLRPPPCWTSQRTRTWASDRLLWFLDKTKKWVFRKWQRQPWEPQELCPISENECTILFRWGFVSRRINVHVQLW